MTINSPPPPYRKGGLINVIMRNVRKVFKILPFEIKFAKRLYGVYWKKYGRFHEKAGLYLEMHIADHCNLNCAYCSHYSPLAKTEFVDIVQCENDFKRLAKLGAGNIDTLRLMGGEPLLNDKISSIARLARECFPKCRIEIVTNGVLLLKQSEEFWNICSKYNIDIFISYYPVNLDYDAVKKLTEKHKIKLTYDDSTPDRKMTKFELDLDGEQDYQESFKKCRDKLCGNLRNGKIYKCPTSANIGVFNEYFSKNLELSKQDYIDIYEAKSIDEIFKFANNPVPFCRFCVRNGNYVESEWRTSKKDISEWAAQKT
ncbi:MAG: radical SAM protein [Spirochaetaceae bacterium]|nr:radical SAM protein [Spirochaetaceae bacterium]